MVTSGIFRCMNVCSWNARGVKEMWKKQAIFSMARLRDVGIFCLQETHLDKGTTSVLRHRNYQEQYHSTYTSYSRGVSVQISTGLVFSCRQSKLDKKGRYVFLFCNIEGRDCILASVYIPPPFSTEILSELLSFIADKPGVPVIVMGDFNMAMDNCLDRLPTRVVSGGVSRGPLLQFCNEVGWVDIWRKWHPDVKQYSCHSRTHATLSRI